MEEEWLQFIEEEAREDGMEKGQLGDIFISRHKYRQLRGLVHIILPTHFKKVPFKRNRKPRRLS